MSLFNTSVREWLKKSKNKVVFYVKWFCAIFVTLSTLEVGQLDFCSYLYFTAVADLK